MIRAVRWSMKGGTVTLDNVTFDTFVDWNYRHVSVLYRVQFPLDTNTPAQVWYYVEDNAVVGEKNLRAGIDGFNVELPDDVNSDPCKGYIPTVNDPDDPEYDPDFTFTFYYDRKMAAEYGMAQAYENDTNDPGTGRVTYNLWASGYPFPNFFYTNLTGEEGATGSAFFTSELIWIGGMPMTRGVPETPGEETCDNDHDANTSGWRYCRSEEHGSFSWRAHEALMAYYSSSAGLASYENNTLDEHGVFIGMFYDVPQKSDSKIA
ncbi:MAG: hypothetical protein KJ064_27685 [Anaerolineae bacterium]|nr:hypothetical protein [Anaerolineae bacterium]